MLGSIPSDSVDQHRHLKQEDDGHRHEEQRQRVRGGHEGPQHKRAKPNDAS